MTKRLLNERARKSIAHKQTTGADESSVQEASAEVDEPAKPVATLCESTNNDFEQISASREALPTPAQKWGRKGCSRIGLAHLGIASMLVLISSCSSDDGESSLDNIETISCSVDKEHGEATIECPDGTSVTIADGEDGRPGDEGKAGRDGEPGKDGKSGEDGESGQKGDIGKKGDPGRDGDPGPKGDPGAEGEPGMDGPPGEKGDAGTSCSVKCDDEHTVRIYCDDGNEVTQQVESCTEEGGPLGLVPDATVLAGAVGDTTNPALALRVVPGGAPVEELVVTAMSSDESVLPTANITIEGAGRERTVLFEPTARGSATVTLTVKSAEEEEAQVTVDYVVSGTVPDASGRYHHGISDASTVIDVGDGYMLLAGDAENTISLYAQNESGPALEVWDFSADDQLGSDPVRIESSARRGSTIVWLGSQAHAPGGQVQVRSRVIFGTTVLGSGADVQLAFSGRYGGGTGTDEEVGQRGLWADLIAWDHDEKADYLDLFAASQEGVSPTSPQGFSIEGFEFADGTHDDPDTTGYLALRTPTLFPHPIPSFPPREGAVLVPINNILELVEGIGVQSGRAEFGDAQFDSVIASRDLEGRSMRAVRRNPSGDYLIVASPSEDATPGESDTWALYTWDGNGLNDPILNQELPAPDFLVGGEWEGIVSVPDPIVPGARVRLIADSGETDFYGTGKATHLEKELQKSYSQEFALN